MRLQNWTLIGHNAFVYDHYFSIFRRWTGNVSKIDPSLETADLYRTRNHGEMIFPRVPLTQTSQRVYVFASFHHGDRRSWNKHAWECKHRVKTGRLRKDSSSRRAAVGISRGRFQPRGPSSCSSLMVSSIMESAPHYMDVSIWPEKTNQPVDFKPTGSTT